MPDTKCLVSWIGNTDLQLASGSAEVGPLLSVIKARPFDALFLLHNQPQTVVEPFLAVVRSHFSGSVHESSVSLTSPIHFGDIYKSLSATLTEAQAQYPNCKLTIQLTSGTPAMAAVSILVGKSMYQASFIQSSIEQGVEDADIPFDIAADFLPSLSHKRDQDLQQLMAGEAPLGAAFDSIVTQSQQMESLKQKAAILARREVPVLIYGETGTGKELFAKAIRNSSNRADKPFLVLNCGAIPQDLIDSTLFGHAKGAFTGAVKEQ